MQPISSIMLKSKLFGYETKGKWFSRKRGNSITAVKLTIFSDRYFFFFCLVSSDGSFDHLPEVLAQIVWTVEFSKKMLDHTSNVTQHYLKRNDALVCLEATQKTLSKSV